MPVSDASAQRPVVVSSAAIVLAGNTVIVGTAGDPRVAGFQAARRRAGLPAAALIDYRELIADPPRVAAGIASGTTVRIESPGRDAAVLAGLLGRGIAASLQQGEHHLTADEIPRHVGERGRLLPPRQLYRGLAVLLAALTERADANGITLVPDATAILLAFDKTECRDALQRRDVPVPRALPSTGSFDELSAAMQSASLSRVFIKLRHGSAAAGTVALATSRHGVSAITTVEMDNADGAARLYNTRKLRHITSAAEIARLVDALAPHGLHVEAWVPKAGIGGRSCDMRVLIIGGEPAFRVLRLSRHPITNLHLGGERADADLLLSRMSAPAVAALDTTVQRVAKAFPGALQLGIDVAVTTGLKRHYVLEVNAFGDLLNGIERDGQNAYDLQVRAMEPA